MASFSSSFPDISLQEGEAQPFLYTTPCHGRGALLWAAGWAGALCLCTGWEQPPLWHEAPRPTESQGPPSTAPHSSAHDDKMLLIRRESVVKASYNSLPD